MTIVAYVLGRCPVAQYRS